MAEEKKNATEQNTEVPQGDSGGGKEKPAKPAQPEEKKAEKTTAKAEAQPKQDTASEPSKDKGKSDIQVSEKMKGIISSIEGMSVLELSNLVKVLEEKFGVTAAQPMMAVAGMAGAGGPGAAAVEEKTSFAVVLASVGPNKIQVIKEIRGITTLGLKEAKDLVEAAPKQVKEGVAKEEAEQIKKKLEAVGAKVELK